MITSSRVQPTTDVNKEFEDYCATQLATILAEGTAHKYVNGRLRRAWGLCSFAVCFAAYCTPCAIWDSMCCASEFMCKKSACWGASCLCISHSIDEIYKTTDSAMKAYFKDLRGKISAETVKRVCTTWLHTFDGLIATRRISDAKKANILRSALVDLIRYYAPFSPDTIALVDDGNIDHLRAVIKKIA